MAELLDTEGKPTMTVNAPDDPLAIMWDNRLFVRVADDRYQETVPTLAHEPVPEHTVAAKS